MRDLERDWGRLTEPVLARFAAGRFHLHLNGPQAYLLGLGIDQLAAHGLAPVPGAPDLTADDVTRLHCALPRGGGWVTLTERDLRLMTACLDHEAWRRRHTFEVLYCPAAYVQDFLTLLDRATLRALGDARPEAAEAVCLLADPTTWHRVVRSRDPAPAPTLMPRDLGGSHEWGSLPPGPHGTYGLDEPVERDAHGTWVMNRAQLLLLLMACDRCLAQHRDSLAQTRLGEVTAEAVAYALDGIARHWTRARFGVEASRYVRPRTCLTALTHPAVHSIGARVRITGDRHAVQLRGPLLRGVIDTALQAADDDGFDVLGVPPEVAAAFVRRLREQVEAQGSRTLCG